VEGPGSGHIMVMLGSDFSFAHALTAITRTIRHTITRRQILMGVQFNTPGGSAQLRILVANIGH
jgi:hypothetical protein